MAQNEKDSQHTKYLLTQNNPKEHGIDKEKLFDILGIMGQKLSLTYACFAKEIGNEENTPHYHIFLNFSSKTRFRSVQRYFQSAHIEGAKGSIEQNVAYVQKSGVWAESEKHNTIIEGTFQEWGTKPESKKEKNFNLYKSILEKIKAGYPNAKIYDFEPCSIKGFPLDKVRQDYLSQEYKNKKRDIEVTYIYGETGTGKTTAVYELESLYCVSSYSNPFDEYSNEDVLALDEFRESLTFTEILRILDKFPVNLPARYTNRTAVYTKVFMLSNWSLINQYKNTNQTDLDAFRRRFHKIQVYQKVIGSNDNYYVRVLEFSNNEYFKNPNIPLKISEKQIGTAKDKFSKYVIKINQNPDSITKSFTASDEFEYCQQSIF